MKKSDIPQFGLLQGVRVLVMGPNIAGPQAGSFMADNGAETLLIEGPVSLDPGRQYPSGSYQKKGKNQRCLIMDWTTDEGRDILLRIVKDMDILIEGHRANKFNEWGISDEVLWSANRKLVICHISGYGQTGDPKYVKRGSYDAITQAFGGLMNLNGTVDEPMSTNCYNGDFYGANVACWSSLMAYICAQRTGKGESLDIAAYEAVFANQNWFENYANYGVEYKRAEPAQIGGWQSYKCKDGRVFCATLGPGFMRKGLKFIGLDPEAPEYKGKMLVNSGQPGCQEIIDALTVFCASKTMQEADDLLNDNGICTSMILGYKEQLANSHYKARKSYIEFDRGPGKKPEKYITTGVLPVCKNNPGKVWRAAPLLGEDNEDVLTEVGCSSEQIKSLYDKGILLKDNDPEQGFYRK